MKPLQQHAFFQLETCLPRLFPSCDVFCPVTTSFCHRLQEAVLEGVFQCVFKDVSVQRKETGIKQTISHLYFVIETRTQNRNQEEKEKEKKKKKQSTTIQVPSGERRWSIRKRSDPLEMVRRGPSTMSSAEIQEALSPMTNFLIVGHIE